MGEIQQQELVSIGDLYTKLSMSTDKVTITLFYYFCENYIILSNSFRGKLSFVEITTWIEDESNNRAPKVVSQSEQPPVSASDPVDAATKVTAVDQPTPP
ncbi:unnamed protein product, partial [Brassica oleracea]